jgi:hypothetical protein
MAVKINSIKTLNNQEYITLSGVTGKTSIKSLEKKYKGEFRLIGSKPVIIRNKK